MGFNTDSTLPFFPRFEDNVFTGDILKPVCIVSRKLGKDKLPQWQKHLHLLKRSHFTIVDLAQQRIFFLLLKNSISYFVWIIILFLFFHFSALGCEWSNRMSDEVFFCLYDTDLRLLRALSRCILSLSQVERTPVVIQKIYCFQILHSILLDHLHREYTRFNSN